MAKAIARIIDDEEQAQPQAVNATEYGPLAEQMPGPRPVAQVAQMPEYSPTAPAIQIGPQGAPQITGPVMSAPPPTAGQKLVGLGEIGLQMATGAAAQPLSGLGGIAKTITSGPEAGAKTQREIEQALTYEPRGTGAQVGMQNVARGIAPVAGPVMRGMEKTADIAADIGGPAAGAAVATLPTAIAEIWGLKGTKQLRKNMMKRLFKEAEISDIIDDTTGMLRQGVDEALQQTDLGIDDIKEILPGALKEEAEQLGKVAASKAGQQGNVSKMGKLVEQAEPDPDIVKAAQEFGVLDDMLTSMTSKNPTHRALVQGLTTGVVGSRLAARTERLLERVSQRADALIESFGGKTSKSSVSDKFRADARQVVDDLEKSAEIQYSKIKNDLVREAGTQKVPIEANNVMDMIEAEAAGLPSESELKPIYKYLKKKLGYREATPDSAAYQPTYQLLDQIRQEIGAGYKGKGAKIFASAEKAELDKIYGAIAADQSAAAARYGLGDAYRSATQTIITRKGIENKLINTMGKDLAGNITRKAELAIKAMGKGDTKAWDQLSENIPRELGKDTRREIFATALNDAFAGQSRKKTLAPAAFDDFMKRLNRDPGIKRRIAKEIGQENFARLEKFHTLVGGIRRALDKSIWTGRTLNVPGVIDDVKTMAQRLYGAVEGPGKRMPGIGRIFGAGIDVGPRVARSVTADELLDSPKFRNAVFQKALGNLEDPQKMYRANQAVERTKAYQKWYETLEPIEKKELAKVGAVGYLMGQTVTKEKE